MNEKLDRTITITRERYRELLEAERSVGADKTKIGMLTRKVKRYTKRNDDTRHAVAKLKDKLTTKEYQQLLRLTKADKTD